ncbi:MAG: ester cyclase [Hyphomicrobiales bacterium]|nr:ester cyclase [Hyphomicrobiales bacterium]
MTPEEHAAISAESLAVIKTMELALGENTDNMSDYFREDFRWIGNFGSGTKEGVGEFRRNWQLPFRAAFTDRDYKTERILADGEWVSGFGHIEATHSGLFMGLSATGKRVRIPYMDFWHVRDGKIADNRVSVDLPSVLAQLGRDAFAGDGWEAYDRNEKTPPEPSGQLGE